MNTTPGRAAADETTSLVVRRHLRWGWFTLLVFLTLGLGYYFGKFTYKGIGLGSVTATLLAGVLIGQIGITIGQPLKATVFLMFLFSVGYSVGPQFVRGVAKDGLPQALFSAIQCVLSLVILVVIAKVAHYDLGYAAGLYAGSQTVSASMGLATDAILPVRKVRQPIFEALRESFNGAVPELLERGIAGRAELDAHQDAMPLAR